MKPDRSIRNFFSAVAFLSRLPIPQHWQLQQGRDYRRLPDAFWTAGLFLGLIQALALWGLVFVFPIDLSIALFIGFQLVITGAFHEDGWADLADSFGAYSTERKLEIMKDSRLGTFGVSALVVLLLVRFLCLKELLHAESHRVFFLVFILSATTRLCIPQLLHLLPYLHKNRGIAEGFSPPSYTSTTAGIALLLLIAIPTLSWSWTAILVGVHGVTLAIVWIFFKNYLNGINGDCLGAATVSSEILSLVAISALIS